MKPSLLFSNFAGSLIPFSVLYMYDKGWEKVFRIIPELEVFRLTFHRVSHNTELGTVDYSIFRLS